MFIDKLVVKGLKCLKHVRFRFDKFSIIIGKNDIGKSTSLRALDIFLNDAKPEFDEFTKGQKQMEIAVTFLLTNEELEDQEIIAKLGSYLDNKKLTVRKIFVSEEDKVKTPDIYVEPGEKLIKPKEWKDLKEFLPQFIYIRSIRDIDKASRVNSQSILGKLMLPLIENEKTISDKKEKLEASISSQIEDVFQDVQNILREQSPDVRKLEAELEIRIERGINLNISVDDGYTTTHIEKKGSGIQSSLIVSLFRVYARRHFQKNIVFGIEEPDAFLHVGAQRKIVHSLQLITQDHGQVILTTHSTVFIDRGNLKGITLLKRDENREVVAKRIKKDRDTSAIQEELEIRNSDWLLWDAVLMVEGDTERKVIDIWARTWGENLDSIGIKILKMGGKDKALYYANASILDDLGIPYAVILDSDNKNPEEYCQYLVKNTKIQEDACYILKKREIENYYPKEAIQKAFPEADLCSITFGDHEDVKTQLKEILGNNISQATIGKKVAEEMKAEEIPSEIRNAIQYLKSRVVAAGEEFL
ncbi:ATP-dependent nuclease [Thermoactinomyces mirandus]|uniref:AAA family ATPase n=1 Tax=Thermoactinomyces mirandus TaxID=2756294 RepID=A0A7W1XV22_9BACL|nr:AAA family ATPase [Thermoactinomyces mirandus]MBA4603809.1 AAA family ATPase [Thermoactinomyces mirandus]